MTGLPSGTKLGLDLGYWRGHREQFISIALFFLLSRLIFFAFGFYCQHVLDIDYLYGSLYYQYDGIHYTNVGTEGYQEAKLYAFFPLFPLVIRFFALIGLPVAGPLLLNHLLTLMIAFLIYHIVAEDLGRGAQQGLYGALLWVFSPLSVSTCILYSEAIFVFLTTGAYALYLRKRYVTAGIFLGLAIDARSMGAMLFAAFLAVEAYRFLRKRDARNLLDAVKLLVPAGILGALYPLYLQIKLGNWHYFVDVQYELWARSKSNVFDMMVRDFSNFSSNALTVVFTYLSLAACLWILYHAIRGHGDKVLILYLIFTILMVFSTARDHGSVGSFSFYRYLFGCSSVYLLLEGDKLSKTLLVGGALMSIFATAIYCLGGFLI